MSVRGYERGEDRVTEDAEDCPPIRLRIGAGDCPPIRFEDRRQDQGAQVQTILRS